jgi:hypothetical protein
MKTGKISISNNNNNGEDGEITGGTAIWRLATSIM